MTYTHTSVAASTCGCGVGTASSVVERSLSDDREGAVTPALSVYHICICVHVHVHVLCWAQSMDSDNPWMELRKAWVYASHGQSMHCPRIAPAQAQLRKLRNRAHTYVHVHVLGIERAISSSKSSDTLQERRPWLTEKCSRTTSEIRSYNRRRTGAK